MRYLVPILFLAAPAFAQAPQQPNPESRALDAMVQACTGREFLATRQAIGLQDQVSALQKQVTDLTTQNNDQGKRLGELTEELKRTTKDH